MQNLLDPNTIGLLVSGLGFVIYIAVFIRTQRIQQLNLANGVIVFLAYISVIGGIRVIVLSLDKSVCQSTEIEQVYIFIGGLAVVWTSCMEIYKKHRDINDSAA